MRSLETSLQQRGVRADVKRLPDLGLSPQARINMVGTFIGAMCLRLSGSSPFLAERSRRSTPHLPPSSLRRFGLRLPSRDGERLPIVGGVSRLGGVGVRSRCQALLSRPKRCRGLPDRGQCRRNDAQTTRKGQASPTGSPSSALQSTDVTLDWRFDYRLQDTKAPLAAITSEIKLSPFRLALELLLWQLGRSPPAS